MYFDDSILEQDAGERKGGKDGIESELRQNAPGQTRASVPTWAFLV
jgi:hypothetical protein